MILLHQPRSTIFEIAMTSEELIQIRDELGVTNAELARILGIDIKTVYRWLSGENSTPAIAARFLRLLSEAKISGAKAARLISRRMERLQAEAA